MKDIGFFKSTDGAQTWSLLTVGIESSMARVIATDPHVPLRVYGGSSSLGIYRSDDGGLTWIDSTTSGEPAFVMGLYLEDRSPQVLYAYSHEGIYTRDLNAVSVSLMRFTVE